MTKLRYLFLTIILASVLRFSALDKTADLTNNFLTMIFSIGSVVAIWWCAGMIVGPRYRWMKDISAFLLAISPWHIFLINHSWQISFSIFAAILGNIILMKTIKNNKWLTFSVIVLIVLANQFFRPFVLGFANTKVPIWLTDEQRREHGQNYESMAVKFFHNKVINYGLSFLDHYSEHFSGDFLFIVGDVSLNRKISDFGQMYLFDIIFLFVGFFAIVKKFDWKWGIILLWLILAPINSALTFIPPDSLRSALMIVPLIIISSFGAITLFGLIHTYTDGLIRYSSIFAILFLMIWDISRFLHQWL